MRNRFGSFQNTPFKFFTPGRSFRNRNKNTNNNNNAVKAGSNDTRRDGRSNRSNQQRQASQPQSLSQERLPPGQDSTTVIGSIFDSLVELDCLKNFHLTSIILGPFRYLTNFFGILPLTKQMQYSAILFAISFFIFYNNLPGGQSTPPPQSPQSPHQSLSSRNGQIKKRGGRNVPSSSSSSSLSIFRFIILLISLVTMIFSLFIFISALIKVILNYFNNNEEDLLLPHPHLSQQQQNGMRQSSSSYLSEMEMPINMANSNKQRLYRHHHNTQQQRYSSSSQQNAHLIHNHNHNHNLGGYDRLGRPNDIYYAPTGDQYERLLTVPEMRRMQQQRAAASGGGAGIVGSSTYHEQKEFEEHTGLGSHGRRNLQSLSPNRKLALDPHATVDRESMERELNKDAVKLDIINQQFGRVSPPKLRQQRSQYSSNSNVTGGGGDLNSSTGASGVLNSPQNSYSRSRSKTRSPRLAFMNFGDSARSSGIGGISGVGGMSVVSGTTGAGSRGSRGSRVRGVPSVAETDLAIAKTMAELRQEATPISRVLGGMKFTPAPHNLHNMDLLATPMNRKYGHGHGHHGRSRTPTGTKSRLHMHNNMNRIDENPAPMSIDKSLISGVGASGGSTMSRRSKDDSFVINRRFIAPTNLKNQYFPQQNQQQHRQMMNNNNNNSNNMNDINRQRAQYDAMLNDRGMYGNVNLRMNRIDPNAPASLAVQQQRQQQLEQQQRLQMQQQQGLISPFDGKFEQRMPLSPFSRQTELDQMKKQSHESRFMQKYGIGSSRSTGSGKYVGNSGSQHRSDFIAEYLERSSKLYENLDIDTQIHHWSSNMRWVCFCSVFVFFFFFSFAFSQLSLFLFLVFFVCFFANFFYQCFCFCFVVVGKQWMSDKLKEKHNNWCQNNKHIDELFVHLNQWFPNNRQQFTQFSATLEKKVEFVLTNEGKLGEISRQRNAPLIQSIVATRKSIKDNADKIDPNTKYIFQRLTEFCDSTNLNEFQWNSGMLFVVSCFH